LHEKKQKTTAVSMMEYELNNADMEYDAETNAALVDQKADAAKKIKASVSRARLKQQQRKIAWEAKKLAKAEAKAAKKAKAAKEAVEAQSAVRQNSFLPHQVQEYLPTQDIQSFIDSTVAATKNLFSFPSEENKNNIPSIGNDGFVIYEDPHDYASAVSDEQKLPRQANLPTQDLQGFIDSALEATKNMFSFPSEGKEVNIPSNDNVLVVEDAPQFPTSPIINLDYEPDSISQITDDNSFLSFTGDLKSVQLDETQPETLQQQEVEEDKSQSTSRYSLRSNKRRPTQPADESVPENFGKLTSSAFDDEKQFDIGLGLRNRRKLDKRRQYKKLVRPDKK
jgi:hypothetical protein